MSEHLKPDIAPEIPPAMPIVVMDLAIGKQIELIDFNYANFYALAHENGISDEDVAQLNITIKANEDSFRRGTYIHSKRQIKIFGVYEEGSTQHPEVVLADDDTLYTKDNLHNLSVGQKLDVVLRHETGHWVNDLTDKVGERLRRFNVSVYSTLGSLGIVGAVALPIEQRNPWLVLATPVTLLFSVLAMETFWEIERKVLKIGHNPHDIPHEKPAYEFEAKSRNFPVVSVSVKELEKTEPEPTNERTGLRGDAEKVLSLIFYGTKTPPPVFKPGDERINK